MSRLFEPLASYPTGEEIRELMRRARAERSDAIRQFLGLGGVGEDVAETVARPAREQAGAAQPAAC